MAKIVWVIVKEGGPTGPPLGLKRIKYTLGPLGLKYKLFQVKFVGNFLKVLYTNPYKSNVNTLQMYMLMHAHIFNKYN